MLDNTRAWAEIDLDAVAHNVRAVRRVTSPRAKLIGVVKADAYGHGAAQVSRCLLENGTDLLAVSQLDEALELRLSGISRECRRLQTPARRSQPRNRHPLSTATLSSRPL